MTPAEPETPPEPSPAQAPAPELAAVSRAMLFSVAPVAVAALVACALLWQKLSTIQEQLARQSADAGNLSVEARALARQAQDLARETAARQAVTDARVSEVALTTIPKAPKLDTSRDHTMCPPASSAGVIRIWSGVPP